VGFFIDYHPRIGIADCEMDHSKTTGDVHVSLVVDGNLPIGNASEDVDSVHSKRLMNRPRAIKCQHLKTRIGKMHHDSVKQSIRTERNSTKLVGLKKRRNHERSQESPGFTVLIDITLVAGFVIGAVKVPWSKCEVCIRILDIADYGEREGSNLKKSMDGYATA